VKAAGYRLGNMDITVVLQQPKLSVHKREIVGNLVSLLGCDAGQVNVKGKTHEHVDAIGEGRAIACHVVVLLLKTV
jgi:2-C-methyl-D-erythritol 2,4-cyclodiphosphate synthase